MHRLLNIRNSIISFFLSGVLSASPRRLDTILGVLECLRFHDREWKENSKVLRKLIREGHPFTVFLTRLNEEITPKCRRKLLTNLIVGGWLNNQAQRKKFKEEHGFLPPLTVSIAPTSKCNLNCAHCSAAITGSEELDLAVLNRVVEESRDNMGVHYFILTGGEPLLYPHFFDLLERYPDCYFQIFTNGTLIDDGALRKLKDLGNALLMVSVEGFEEITDRRRRKGAFKMAVEAMRRLRSAGLPFGFSVMTTRENCESVTSEEFIDWALDRGCLLGYYFHYMPMGQDPDLSLLPTPEQRDQSRRNVYRWRNEKPIVLIDVLNDGPLTAGCSSAGRYYVHVLPSGEVTPCVYNLFSTHNVKEVSLTDALKSPYLSTLRRTIPFEGNALRCCLLLDRPKFFFRTLELFHPKSPTPGAEETLKGMKHELEAYAKRIKEIYDEAWERGDWESIIKSIRFDVEKC